MKTKLSFLVVICLSVILTLPVSASQTTTTKDNTILSNISSNDNFTISTTQKQTTIKDSTKKAPKLPLMSDMYTVINDAPIDNNILSLYENNVFKNDYFKFNVTSNNYWNKASYDEAYTFANSNKSAMTYFVSNDQQSSVLVALMAIPPENKKMLDIDLLFFFTLVDLGSDIPMSNVSDPKNSSLSGVPFKYVTFDATINEETFKTYLYMGIKGENVFIISPINVTTANKGEISKLLKSIVIK